MAMGAVKWWNDEKGFGFITATAGYDLFVHASEIQSAGFQTLEDGVDVEFEEAIGPHGPMATNVRRPGETRNTTVSKKALPPVYVTSFSAPTARQIEHEANELSRDLGHQIKSISITQGTDGGYVAVAIYGASREQG